MLLHVVEAAAPIHLPGHLFGESLVGQKVNDRAIRLAQLHSHYGHTRESPPVGGLSTRRGVERRAVQHYGRLPVPGQPLHDGGLELHQVGVVVVEHRGVWTAHAVSSCSSSGSVNLKDDP